MSEETKKNNKDTSKYLPPVVGYSAFAGALALAIGIALAVLLPLL